MSLTPIKTPSPPGVSSQYPGGSQSARLPNTSLPPAATPDQPVKRGRRSNPKVKTGCTNCKQRRIKCDEKRPECTQCVRSGKSCTGYPPPSRSSRSAMEIRIAPKPLAAMQPAPALAPSTVSQPIGISMLQKHTVLPPRRAGRRKKMLDGYKQIASATPRVLHQPSMALPLQPVEHMYFELFRVHTASQLSGYFNSDFWTQRVLQECHRESAIRHSVVALGAVYKTLELSFETPYDMDMQRHTDSIMAHWQVAIKQYSDTCNAMLSFKSDALHSHTTRLIAIVLLACFDSFIGDHKQAIIQIQTGLGLLNQSQRHRSSDILAALSTDPDELVTLFSRLAIQAKSYDLAFHFPEPYVIKLGSTPTQPDSPGSDPSSPSTIGSPPREGEFESIVEARLASDRLSMALLMFVEQLHAAKTNPGYVLPAAWKKYGMGLKDRLAAWAEAYEPILASRLNTPDMPYIERASIAALKMFQINATVIFLMLFCDNELQFDAFLPHFKMIVDLGWEVIGADESRFAAEGNARDSNAPSQQPYVHGTKGAFQAGKYGAGRLKPSFSADLGIVAPLFVVASKCREPWLRRQAIQLLKSSARREGMWDSELTANIAIWMMQLEEEGIPGGGGAAVPPALDPRNPTGGYVDANGVLQRTIPEDRRIMLKAADFDLRARFADLAVGTRSIHKDGVDGRLKKTRISW